MRIKVPVSVSIIKWLIRIIIMLFAIMPIYACLIVALTPYSNIMQAQLLPKHFEINNFTKAFHLIFPQMMNSFLYSILTVIFTLLISIPSAYVLTRYNFKAKKVLLFGLLLTQMTAGIVVLPSLYSLYSKIHLIDSLFGLVLTLIGINLALTIWLLLGFFASLPYEVEEAAIVDGISSFMLLIKIVVPMSAPGIAVSAIFIFINSYNEFVVPLFLLTDSRLYPLTMTLYSLLSDTTVQWNLLASSAILGLIPPVLIYLFSQQFIIKGIASGAVKN